MKRAMSVLLPLAVAATMLPACGKIAPTPRIEIIRSERIRETIVKEIENAKKAVFVQVYSFDSEPAAKALSEAKDRGINVIVVLDGNQKSAASSSLSYFRAHGIEVYLDEKPANHSRVIIIDNSDIITGSFDFTNDRETRDGDNLLLVHEDDAVARQYLETFDRHLKHSGKLVKRYEERP